MVIFQSYVGLPEGNYHKKNQKLWSLGLKFWHKRHLTARTDPLSPQFGPRQRAPVVEAGKVPGHAATLRYVLRVKV